jgi:hypothetical protein
LETHTQSGSKVAKLSPSWRPEYGLHKLENSMALTEAIIFQHIKQNDNAIVDRLANKGASNSSTLNDL